MKRFFTDFKNYFHYAVYSAKASLQAEVAGSYLNWLWWVFNPLCLMVIYSIVFGTIFDAKEKYFSVFIFIGLTLWDYFNRTITSSIKVVKANKAIVTKVFLPKFILSVQLIFINFVKMLFSIGIIIIMMIFYRVPITWNVLWIFPLLVVYTIFIFACSTIMLHYGVFIEDLNNIVRIILRFVYYLTGIFFSVEKRIPVPYNYYVVRLNPLSYFITSARKVLIYQQPLYWKWLIAWLVVSVLLAIFGVYKIYKYENSYAKVI